MRVHNFGAGPCTLPVDVLEEVRDEFLDFAGSGMSVVELSHRSSTYDQVHQEAMAVTRRVSGVPDDFAVMFIQGGATLQFGMIPMNLLPDGQRAAHVVSGTWGKKALADGVVVGDAVAVWDGADSGYTTMPGAREIVLPPETAYLHVTSNETIGGIRMVEYPEVDVPLVGDMSSDYLSRPIDWSRFGAVYGGIQKNLGPSGMALVFVRRDLIGSSGRQLPVYLDYEFHADSDSLGNTPAMFSIYVMGKVLADIEARGGVAALEQRSAEKAALVYDTIESSDGFYRSPVDPAVRSHMNVVFRLPSEDLETRFVKEATAAGLVGLKGHRSVGGCRASLYAALDIESVQALVAFMQEFQRKT